AGGGGEYAEDNAEFDPAGDVEQEPFPALEERMHARRLIFDFDGAERGVAADDEGGRVDARGGARGYGAVLIGAENGAAVDHDFPGFGDAQFDGAKRGIDVDDG